MAVFTTQIKELVKFRYLLRSWTIREIKIRYKQSILGGVWAVIQPLSIAMIFSVIFTYFIKVPTEGVPRIIFYYSVLFPWTFFTNSVTQGANSLVNNQNLVTKIYFPREVLPIATIIAALLDFGIAFLVYLGLAAIYGITLGLPLVLLPVLILSQLLFTIAVVLFLAALNVFFRDIRFVIPLLLQIYMYSVPLIYSVSTVPSEFRLLYLLNPLAAMLHAYRSILVYNQWPEMMALVYPLAVALVLFFISYVSFTKASKTFADLI